MTAPRVMLIGAPNCHLCEHAHDVLERITRSGVRFDVVEANWSDAEPALLIERDGVPFLPALYVDGALWAYGRLSERALRKRFEAR